MRAGSFAAVSTCATSGYADDSVTVVVRSEKPDVRYEFVARDNPTLIRSCASYRVACRHLLPVGHYTFAVPPTDQAPGTSRAINIARPTWITIKPGSRTVEHVGIGMMVGGAAAAVGGLIAYMFAVTGSTVQSSRPNPAATVWGITAGGGVVIALAGVLTFASGATTVSVVHRF